MATNQPVDHNINTSDRNPPSSTAQMTHKNAEVRLTPEEIRILHECNRESFYLRSLPFAIAGMAGTYLAIQRGIFKPHPKFGATFKMMGAGFVGWIIGKFSYRRKCEDKFLHLQNSALADAIRKKRGLIVESFPNDGSTMKESGDFSSSPMSSEQDYHSSYGSLNLDTDKNVRYTDFNDRLTPDAEYTGDSSETASETKVRKPPVTYDELRRRNREQQNVRQPSPSLPPPPVSRWDKYSPPVRKDSQKEEGYSGGEGTKNTYGDVWEK